MNLFRYVNNSPLNYTDPSGNEAFLVTATVVILGGIVTNLLIPPPPAQTPTDCDDIHEDKYFWQRLVVGTLVGAGIEKAIASGLATGVGSTGDDIAREGSRFIDDAGKGIQ